MDSINTNFKLMQKNIYLSATNIILIGFMGSGKSSAGRLLAKKMNKQFLDTDAMIESSEGISIPEIFSMKGEAYFRQKEAETVSWLNKNCKNAEISTGGGMLVHCPSLADVGKIVYLHVPFKTILERMSKDELEKRPLFKDPIAAEMMYKERDEVYERKSNHIIDASVDLENVVSKLVSLGL